MLSYFHTVPRYAFRNRPLTLQLVVADGVGALSKIELQYKAQTTSHRLRLFPTDGFRAEESYSLYSTTLPAAHLEGEECGSYTVPLCTMPTMPPFVLTETGTEMVDGAGFYEICNPGEQTVDLFDFELALLQKGKIVGRGPLADRAGENLLACGESAVFRPLSAERLNLYGDPEADMQAFWDTVATCFPAECADVTEHLPRVMTAMHATRTASGWQALAGTFPIAQTAPHHLHILPRGKGLADSLYSIPVNYGSHRDVPARTAAHWGIDLRDPAHGFLQATKQNATPGFAAEGQVLPFVGDDVVPAVLPITPMAQFCLSTGDWRVRFVTFPHDVGEPALCVLCEHGWRRYPARRDQKGAWELTVPYAALAAVGRKLSYFIEVSGRCYPASLGSKDSPLTLRIVDDTGPLITSLYPAEGQAIEGETRPTVRVTYFDSSQVNTKTSAVYLDGINVGERAKWGADAVSFRPEKPLALGEHVLELSLRDGLGNRTYHRSAFVVTDGKELQLYRGEVHSHTVESDGRGTFEQAMRHARDVGKADFFAVTDHCCYLTREEIAAQKKIADAYHQNGLFATLYGYEVSWSKKGFWGHMNVLGGDWFLAAADTPMPKLYEKLTDDPSVIAMFNHPCDNWGDFDSFAGHTPELDRRLNLIEVKNATYDEHYAAMLARGWHAAPVVNGDNHNADWITKNDSTGVVLAHSLTRENIMDAMRRGRTYATMDKTMQIRYRVNGEWLGARLHNPKKLSVSLEISTKRPEGIGEVFLVAEDNIVVARAKAGVRQSFCWQLELAPEYDYYYVKIVNGDVYSVTSPVFVERPKGLAISAMTAGISESAELPHAVSVTLKNTASAELTGVVADFYLTPTGGFEQGVQAPFQSVQVGRLGAKKTHTVCALFPNAAQNRRVSVILRGMLGKRRVIATKFLLLTPFLISKICALTSPCGEVENPFPYVELYNHTCAPVALSGYVLNGRHEQGNFRPLYRVITPLCGFTLPAKGRMIVWCRPKGSALTAVDFNTRYGTSFTEGVDLLITEEPLLQADDNGHTLDICLGEEQLSRATYGDFCGGALPLCDVPDYYRHRHDITIREERFTPAAPAPIGEICAEQSFHAVAVKSEEPKKPAGGEKVEKKAVTPMQAATFMANAFNTFKEILSDKD